MVCFSLGHAESARSPVSLPAGSVLLGRCHSLAQPVVPPAAGSSFSLQGEVILIHWHAGVMVLVSHTMTPKHGALVHTQAYRRRA